MPYEDETAGGLSINARACGIDEKFYTAGLAELEEIADRCKTTLLQCDEMSASIHDVVLMEWLLGSASGTSGTIGGSSGGIGGVTYAGGDSAESASVRRTLESVSQSVKRVQLAVSFGLFHLELLAMLTQAIQVVDGSSQHGTLNMTTSTSTSSNVGDGDGGDEVGYRDATEDDYPPKRTSMQRMKFLDDVFNGTLDERYAFNDLPVATLALLDRVVIIERILVAAENGKLFRSPQHSLYSLYNRTFASAVPSPCCSSLSSSLKISYGNAKGPSASNANGVSDNYHKFYAMICVNDSVEDLMELWSNAIPAHCVDSGPGFDLISFFRKKTSEGQFKNSLSVSLKDFLGEMYFKVTSSSVQTRPVDAFIILKKYRQFFDLCVSPGPTYTTVLAYRWDELLNDQSLQFLWSRFSGEISNRCDLLRRKQSLVALKSLLQRCLQLKPDVDTDSSNLIIQSQISIPMLQILSHLKAEDFIYLFVDSSEDVSFLNSFENSVDNDTTVATELNEKFLSILALIEGHPDTLDVVNALSGKSYLSGDSSSQSQFYSDPASLGEEKYLNLGLAAHIKTLISRECRRRLLSRFGNAYNRAKYSAGSGSLGEICRVDNQTDSLNGQNVFDVLKEFSFSSSFSLGPGEQQQLSHTEPPEQQEAQFRIERAYHQQHLRVVENFTPASRSAAAIEIAARVMKKRLLATKPTESTTGKTEAATTGKSFRSSGSSSRPIEAAGAVNKRLPVDLDNFLQCHVDPVLRRKLHVAVHDHKIKAAEKNSLDLSAAERKIADRLVQYGSMDTFRTRAATSVHMIDLCTNLSSQITDIERSTLQRDFVLDLPEIGSCLPDQPVSTGDASRTTQRQNSTVTLTTSPLLPPMKRTVDAFLSIVLNSLSSPPTANFPNVVLQKPESSMNPISSLPASPRLSLLKYNNQGGGVILSEDETILGDGGAPLQIFADHLSLNSSLAAKFEVLLCLNTVTVTVTPTSSRTAVVKDEANPGEDAGSALGSAGVVRSRFSLRRASMASLITRPLLPFDSAVAAVAPDTENNLHLNANMSMSISVLKKEEERKALSHLNCIDFPKLSEAVFEASTRSSALTDDVRQYLRLAKYLIRYVY